MAENEQANDQAQQNNVVDQNPQNEQFLLQKQQLEETNRKIDEFQRQMDAMITSQYEKQNTYQEQPQQYYNDPLIDNFGEEGAAAMQAAFQRQNMITLYNLKNIEGRQIYGDRWNALNYVDKKTGVQGNKVLDAVANHGFSNLEDALHYVEYKNGISHNTPNNNQVQGQVEQKTQQPKEEPYTPTTGGVSAPIQTFNQDNNGYMSFEDAVDKALADQGIKT